MWGSMPLKVLTRRVVVTYAESIQSAASRVVAVAVLYNVLQVARYYGLVEINMASKLGLPSPKPRQARWEWADIESFLEACSDATVRTAFHLLLYTAQRPVDVTQMRWDAYNGETIKLRQQKTGKLVEVPCHRDLRPVLEDAKTRRNGVHIVSRADGTPVKRYWLTDKFKGLREACGLEHLQARDLRRTAIVLMGEAGATEAQIAAVSGHNIESTRQILETYLPRTLKMAQECIRKWEQSE
jgi:integrase